MEMETGGSNMTNFRERERERELSANLEFCS